MIVTGTVVAGIKTARQSWRNSKMTTRTSTPGLDQGLVDFVDRLFDKRGRVVRDRVLHAGRETPLHPLHGRLDLPWRRQAHWRPGAS